MAPLRVLAAPLVHRAERHLLHLAVHSGTNVDLDLTPQDFQSSRHANTWRAIQQLRDRGEPVNYVSVFQETRSPFPHQPVLSDKQLTGMEFAGKPNVSPERIAKSLRTVVDASLSRAFNGSRAALKALASHGNLDPQQMIDQAQKAVAALSGRAQTAGQQHRTIADQAAASRNSAR
jgi:replicative DNA helicase